MKQTYREYLEESTNTVKSKEKSNKLILTLVTLGVWALSVIAFWLVKDGANSAAYSLAVTWAVLPVLFFSVSFIIGSYDYFGKLKWLSALVFGLMCSLSGSVTWIIAEGAQYRSVIWPDFAKLPIGLLISLLGLGVGSLMRHKRGTKPI